MRIAVCVKQVPDSWAEKKMNGQVLDRAGVDAVLNDLDEYAIEQAHLPKKLAQKVVTQLL